MDFAQCKVDQVEIAAGKADRLPKPLGSDDPRGCSRCHLRAGPGGSVNITAGWGMIGMTVNVAVVDGNVTITTENPLFTRSETQGNSRTISTLISAITAREFAAAEILRGKFS